MDSFYEQPRTALVPTSTAKVPAIPEVPEVSMIFQNNAKEKDVATDSIYLSYNAWKTRKQSENSVQRNYCSNSSQQTQSNRLSPPYLSKQVRFESPVALPPQQKFSSCVKNMSVPNSNNPYYPHLLQNKVEESVSETSLPGKPNMFTKPFEQIYMANVPNRHLDLSIIEPVRPTITRKENLENVSPNVNLGINSVNHSIKQPTVRNTNYLTTSKDFLREGSRYNNVNVNNSNKLNDYQYPEKLDKGFGENTHYKKEMERCDSQNITESNKCDPLEKNRVIDLYNYKRGGFETLRTAYGHRQTLDNLQFSNNYNKVETPINMETHKTCSNNCLYDSFDSHNCENGKHICSCHSNKEFTTNPKNNNAAIQSDTTNSCKNLDTSVVNKKSDEPTVKDLLKIIHQQNDQLLVLQKQVATLLNNRDTPKQIEAPPAANKNIKVFGEKCRTSTQLESPQQGLCNPLQKCLPRKGPLPQFSLDVMTSFEVSIRRQQNLNRAYKDAINHQPKICEVTETDSNAFDESPNINTNNVLYGICNKPKSADDSEVSLTLNEPVHVRESCPTPENTVRIDMDDYSSDTDEENSSDDRWFYKNVQGQVNQILRKSGIWNGATSDVSDTGNDIVSQNIRKKVKDATIKHLKSIGVHVPVLDNSDDVIQTDSSNNMGYNPKEVSFAVKQLLMKYLPNEQLAKVACRKTQNTAPQPDPIGLINRRPEFSFATVQYMQKYNLLSDGRKNNLQAQLPPVIRHEENFDRILDVTAIKQQPKLL